MVSRQRYVEDYLEYFNWNIEMDSPSVTGGFVNTEERNTLNDKKRSTKDSDKLL